jgi:hypothetical protein
MAALPANKMVKVISPESFAEGRFTSLSINSFKVYMDPTQHRFSSSKKSNVKVDWVGEICQMSCKVFLKWRFLYKFFTLSFRLIIVSSGKA